MMTSPWPLLLLALSAALAAPSAPYQDYPEVLVPQKRAALVLDRLLIALQKALNDETAEPKYEKSDRDGPRTAPLRIAHIDENDMSSLQRRGQGGGRGRVLRCYFNAVTCF